jgi:hypothetical protein
LRIGAEALGLAQTFIAAAAIPDQALADALHIACATVNRMDFLLTWNCAHIHNAEVELRVEQICRDRHLVCPKICTPEELMGYD